jgi:hypothetical protein
MKKKFFLNISETLIISIVAGENPINLLKSLYPIPVKRDQIHVQVFFLLVSIFFAFTGELELLQN